MRARDRIDQDLVCGLDLDCQREESFASSGPEQSRERSSPGDKFGLGLRNLLKRSERAPLCQAIDRRWCRRCSRIDWPNEDV
jgi:hypothetical protein